MDPGMRHAGPGGHVVRLLSRWLLLGSVITAVFALHVLTADEEHGGHQDPLGMSAAAPLDFAQGRAAPAVGDYPVTVRAHLVAATHPMIEGGHPTGPDHGDGWLTGCILFLTAAAPGALMLLLAVLRGRPGALDRHDNAGDGWTFARRDPPVPIAPRLAAGVIRV